MNSLIFGEIPDFRQKQSTIRSRGISAIVVCQNVSGLENLYPSNRMAKFNSETQI